MKPVILDTDVASLLHRRKLTGPLATRLIGREPLITFITVGELAKWAEIRRWGAHRREELAAWLAGIPVLPGDEAVAAIWGRLSAEASRRGRPRPVNDMWIAACCLAYEAARHPEPQGLRGLHGVSRPAHPRITASAQAALKPGRRGPVSSATRASASASARMPARR